MSETTQKNPIEGNKLINLTSPFDEAQRALQGQVAPVQPNQVEVNQQQAVNGDTAAYAQKMQGAAGSGIFDIKRRTRKFRTIRVQLPSKGLFYPTGSALLGREEVELRNFSAPDEDVLRNPKFQRAGTNVNKMLQGVILDASIRVEELLGGDRDALLLALRVDCLGTIYAPEVKYECKECGSLYVPTFDFSLLKPRFPTMLVSTGNSFKTTLPSGNEVVLRFLTDKENTEISEYLKVPTSLYREYPEVIRRWYRVVSYNNKTDRGEVRDECYDMEPKDYRFIDKFIFDNEPLIEFKQTVECSECLTPQEVAIQITDSFFFPKL